MSSPCYGIRTYVGSYNSELIFLCPVCEMALDHVAVRSGSVTLRHRCLYSVEIAKNKRAPCELPRHDFVQRCIGEVVRDLRPKTNYQDAWRKE